MLSIHNPILLPNCMYILFIITKYINHHFSVEYKCTVRLYIKLLVLTFSPSVLVAHSVGVPIINYNN